ncbi:MULTISPECIES: SDR family oxidoreductase [Micrococcaceae]|uniref:SDR family oxidoreductase n=1 Tax=Micrococcaceae TaxID=1268 RepID=UPI0012F21865|nr:MULTISPECIES: NAD(P)H-binding protein [unclassified Arthrobacter]BCW79617.1 oxidoreductase [Arthrobacter sp. NicSoilC5]VXB06872.1 NAD dependent epimerase/dehydratase family protein [Arthrobacter sp. 8AJ]
MILLVGATGDLGGRVARLLRESGQDVRCLVRRTTDDSPLRAIGAEVARGDLTEPATLPPACEGVQTVVATATAISRRLAGTSSATIRDVDEVGMGHLIDAAEAAGVQRFVYLSFPIGSASLRTPLEQAKLAIERRLAGSPMRAVVVRSDGLQEVQLSRAARFDLAAGKAAVIGKGDNRRRLVSTGDIAALLAAVALEPDPPLQIDVGGPEPLSKKEIIALAGELAHHPMKVQRMPRPVARVATLMLRRRNDAMASALGAGLSSDIEVATWDDTPLRRRGIDPKSVSDFLKEQAQALSGR